MNKYYKGDVYKSDVKKICPTCGKYGVMELTAKEEGAYDSYRFGEGLIQDMLPDFTPAEREFLKTGYCKACQKRLFRCKRIESGKWVESEDGYVKRSYKNYPKISIGSSEYSTLVAVGCSDGMDGLLMKEICFGGDGSYSAYLVDGRAEIGSHYKLVGSFDTWVKIYDDEECVACFYADEIHIYRAKENGCIIQLEYC